MAKVMLGNNQEYILNFRTHNKTQGFTESFEKYSDYSSIVAFAKLNITHKNYFENNDDYVVTTGTLLYKNELSTDALQKLLRDFDGDVNNLRKHLQGNYMLTIKKNKKIYIFCEENNLFDVYYYNSKHWLVSNSLYDIANIVDNSLTINEFNIVESVFLCSIIGKGTFFNEIFKLIGDEVIEIDVTSGALNLKKISHPRVENYEEGNRNHEEEYSKVLKNVARSIIETKKKITVSITGGLDSRTVLSAYLANEYQPRLSYGVGNSPLTNTNNHDLRIAEELSKKFDLALNIRDWRSPEIVDKYWPLYMNKYGFSSITYSASNKIFESYEMDRESEYIEYGYYGETLRNRDWFEEHESDYFTVDQYLDQFYMNKSLPFIYENYSSFREHIRDKLIQLLDDNNLDVNKIHKDDFLLLYNSWFQNSHNRLINFTNMFCYCSSILSDYKLYSIAEQIPFHNKIGASFMLSNMRNISPLVLDVPFHSHCQEWIYSSEQMALTPVLVRSKVHGIKQFLEKVFGQNSKVYTSLRLLYLKTIRSGNKKIVDEILKREKIRGYFKNKEHPSLIPTINENMFQKYLEDVRFDVEYYQLEYIIDSILSSKKNVATAGIEIDEHQK